jgi:hypothetical protein
MKLRRFGFGGLLAVALSLVLAGTSLAGSPFRYIELKDVCQTSGGAHGFGYLTFKVRVKEIGMSGANYFRIKSKVQYKDPNGAGWYTLKTWGWEYSSSFPNNSTTYYHDLKRRFDPDGTPDASAHRMWMRVQVWSNSAGLLDEMIMTGQKCVTGI